MTIPNLLRQMKLPFAYHHFAEGESPKPPFVVYYHSDTDNLSADNQVYYQIQAVVIELYTETKDPKTEKQLEQLLTKDKIFFDKRETWIASERLFLVSYQISLGEERIYE